MNLPNDSQRILIVGRTGGGKTMEALHLLSQRSFDAMPWIVVDFKGDDLASRVPVSAPASIYDGPPSDPGLYCVRAQIEDKGQGGPLSDYFMSIYEQGNTGVFIDEMQMVGTTNAGLRMLLTQGRSKKCPLIMLSQRPAWIDVYCLSESEYIQTFYIQFPDDQEKMNKFIPPDVLNYEQLRQAGLYHSIYYDVLNMRADHLGPCPPFQEIYDRMLTRLPVYVEPEPEPIPRRARL